MTFKVADISRSRERFDMAGFPSEIELYITIHCLKKSPSTLIDRVRYKHRTHGHSCHCGYVEKIVRKRNKQFIK